MRKILVFFILMLNSCYRIPLQEEIEYRGKLENALVQTFPKKIVVVIHPFDNLSKSDTNRAYLEQAIPDNIESMLESLRSSLAYIPFDGMPFYVSSELSNLFQTVETDNSIEIITNNGVVVTNELILDEIITNDYGNIVTNNISTNNNTNENDSYFSYLTNYLLVVPTQETQYNAVTTTNTNYYEMETNIVYQNAVPITNISSNRILMTTTNAIDTNFVVVNKNILTPTNMLLLLYEEFPELTNYLSFLPIEVRRATEEDTLQYQDYKLRLENPQEWKKLQAQKETERREAEKQSLEVSTNDDNLADEILASDTNTQKDSVSKLTKDEINSPYPSDPFEYIYHIGGNYSTKQSESQFGPANANIKMQIMPVYSTGHVWWEEKFNQAPPSLLDILELEASIDPEDLESYKNLYIRTPVEKPPVSPRLRDEFEMYSTNFRDTKPQVHEKSLPKREKPLNLMLNVKEQDIPVAMMDWLKYFHAIIVNRPYTVLRVDTNPPDTLIYLNGVYIGSTPLVYPTAPLGEQRILFLKDGFSREEIFVDVLPNQTNSISYTLQSLNNTGVIRVTSSMPDAEVYVNSLYKGQTPVIISNLTLNEKYRIEVLNPASNLSSNRNSVYKSVTLTEDKSSVDIDARFKSFETAYRTPAQKGLLAAAYVSWFTTIALLGGSVYTQYRYNEALDMISQYDSADTDDQQYNKYVDDRDYYSSATQVTLYSAIAAAVVSTGITGWYLHSKGVFLGMDVDPVKNEWYAKFKLEF